MRNEIMNNTQNQKRRELTKKAWLKIGMSIPFISIGFHGYFLIKYSINPIKGLYLGVLGMLSFLVFLSLAFEKPEPN